MEEEEKNNVEKKDDAEAPADGLEAPSMGGADEADKEPRVEVRCPFCQHEFRLLFNAESLSMIRCPQCGRWFPVHINLGAEPLEMLSMDEFEELVGKKEGEEEEEEEGEETQNITQGTDQY